MTQFRKKPVVIDAVPVALIVASAMGKAVEGASEYVRAPDWIQGAARSGALALADHDGVAITVDAASVASGIPAAVLVKTAEGVMFGAPEDWLIRGVKGELYPCKPNIFEATYEEVTDGAVGDNPGQEEA